MKKNEREAKKKQWKVEKKKKEEEEKKKIEDEKKKKEEKMKNQDKGDGEAMMMDETRPTVLQCQATLSTRL